MNFHYLVQGRSDEMNNVHQVFLGRKYSALTWDNPSDGCLFFPNSTWSEGRRKLLEEVDWAAVDYIAYVDADFIILRGGLEEFEEKIIRFMPAIAVPVVDKNASSYHGMNKFSHGLIFNSDEQFQVIHKEILLGVLCKNPYVSRYDKLSWWYPCVQFQAFLNRFLWRSSLVDIDFEISNKHYAGYPNKFDSNYIHNEISERGICWYFPLTSNGKVYRLNFLYKYFDKLVLLGTIYLFKSLFVPWHKLKFDANAISAGRKFFIEQK